MRFDVLDRDGALRSALNRPAFLTELHVGTEIDVGHRVGTRPELLDSSKGYLQKLDELHASARHHARYASAYAHTPRMPDVPNGGRAIALNNGQQVVCRFMPDQPSPRAHPSPYHTAQRTMTGQNTPSLLSSPLRVLPNNPLAAAPGSGGRSAPADGSGPDAGSMASPTRSRSTRPPFYMYSGSPCGPTMNVADVPVYPVATSQAAEAAKAASVEASRVRGASVAAAAAAAKAAATHRLRGDRRPCGRRGCIR